MGAKSQMPHAEQENNTLTNGDMSDSTPLTNGEQPQSKVLSHLQSYPVVHDALSLYTSNHYGAQSISFTRSLYARLVAPLHPYLQTPYSYVHPYLSRADELGDSGLQKVDSRFPIVKEDTNTLKEKAGSLVGLPLALAGQGKEYVMGAWEDEYKKTKGRDGVVKGVLALVSTELRIGKDAYGVAREYLSKGKEEAGKKTNEVKQ